MIEDLKGMTADSEKQIEDTCYVTINRIKSDNSRLFNRSTVPELFISFLAKFADICSRASAQGISPYTGQWEDIGSNMRWLPKTYALFVEDAFEQPTNTARIVCRNQLVKISEAISATHGILVSPHQTRASIVSALARPHVSNVLVGPPMPIPLLTPFVCRPPMPIPMFMFGPLMPNPFPMPPLLFITSHLIIPEKASR